MYFFIFRAPISYVTKTWRVVLLNKETHILLSQVCCVWQVVKPRQSFRITLYYFHEVIVTLLNDFQRKRNLAFRSSCHLIMDATGTLRMWLPLLNFLPWNFRKIPRDFRIPPRSRQEMRISGVSQKRAHLFWMTLNKHTWLRGSPVIVGSVA